MAPLVETVTRYENQIAALDQGQILTDKSVLTMLQARDQVWQVLQGEVGDAELSHRIMAADQRLRQGAAWMLSPN